MKNTRWTEEEKEQLRTAYPDRSKSIQQIADELGRTKSSVDQMRLQLGVYRQKIVPCDERSFERENPAAAYWAGFLMADGSIQGNCLSLTLSQIDADHIESLRDFLSINNPVLDKKSGIAAGITVSSHILVDGLKRWGVVPRKTYVGEIPRDIPQFLLPHYFRGLIDGDGGIYVYRRGKRGEIWSVTLCNNAMVIDRTRAVFEEALGICPKDYVVGDVSEHTTKLMMVSNKSEVRRVLEWLDYSGPGPSLPRKRDKALTILSRDPSMTDMRKCR